MTQKARLTTGAALMLVLGLGLMVGAYGASQMEEMPMNQEQEIELPDGRKNGENGSAGEEEDVDDIDLGSDLSKMEEGARYGREEPGVRDESEEPSERDEAEKE